MQIHPLDLTNAYCQANLTRMKHRTLLRQYRGYELRNVEGSIIKGPGNEQIVMKLQMALYGLAISRCELYSQLTDTLVKMGFRVNC